MITKAILGVPYYNCSIMGPKSLFQLFRPLLYAVLGGPGSAPASIIPGTVLNHCSSLKPTGEIGRYWRYHERRLF